MRTPLPKIGIRRATVDDAGCLARLVAEMDDEVPAMEEWDARSDSMRTLLAEMATYPGFHAWLIMDGDTPVGSFSLLVFRSPSHGGSPQALLDAVVITHARRGEGIGEAMLQEAMRLAREAGCYKLALSSSLQRMDAHRFYEMLGFTQHGISFAIAL
jgi:GNAT superfamily N-acetyltransferase